MQSVILLHLLAIRRDGSTLVNREFSNGVVIMQWGEETTESVVISYFLVGCYFHESSKDMLHTYTWAHIRRL